MSPALFSILFFILGLVSLILFRFYLMFKMKNHVSTLKAKHVVNQSKIIRNTKVYFKNFAIFRRKKFFSSSPLKDPLYNFDLCDVYFNFETILLIGKANYLGRINEINITVFYKNPAHRSNTILKDLRRTNSHLEIEFEDSRFDKDIIAMIRMEKQDEIEKWLKNWI